MVGVSFFSSSISTACAGSRTSIASSGCHMYIGIDSDPTDPMHPGLCLVLCQSAAVSHDHLDFDFSKFLAQFGMCLFAVFVPITDRDRCSGADLHMYCHSVCRKYNSVAASSRSSAGWVSDELLDDTGRTSHCHDCISGMLQPCIPPPAFFLIPSFGNLKSQTNMVSSFYILRGFIYALDFKRNQVHFVICHR